MPQTIRSEFYSKPELHLKYSALTTLSSKYLVYYVELDNLLMPMHQQPLFPILHQEPLMCHQLQLLEAFWYQIWDHYGKYSIEQCIQTHNLGIF